MSLSSPSKKLQPSGLSLSTIPFNVYRTYGVCTWPLLYIIRDSVHFLTEVEDPLQGSEDFGSSESMCD